MVTLSVLLIQYYLLIGRDPLSLMRYGRGIAQGEQAEQLLLNRDAMLTESKFFLKHAQERMKIQYDKHHRELSFQVGDMVLSNLGHTDSILYYLGHHTNFLLNLQVLFLS